MKSAFLFFLTNQRILSTVLAARKKVVMDERIDLEAQHHHRNTHARDELLDSQSLQQCPRYVHLHCRVLYECDGLLQRGELVAEVRCKAIYHVLTTEPNNSKQKSEIRSPIRVIEARFSCAQWMDRRTTWRLGQLSVKGVHLDSAVLTATIDSTRGRSDLLELSDLSCNFKNGPSCVITSVFSKNSSTLSMRS